MITENFQILNDKISDKCLKIGRNRDEIRLIAVSKTRPIPILLEALNAGILDLGENKAQELRDKSQAISENVIWHFIGHLQTNKVKYVINAAEYIHSVESLKLAEEINKRAAGINKVQKVLLEINTSAEASKFGLRAEEEIIRLTEYCESAPSINLKGLMTMAPYTENADIIRDCFKRLFDLKEELNQKGFNLSELSMGMTNDYEIAIEEGATMLRVGTAIFGERNYI